MLRTCWKSRRLIKSSACWLCSGLCFEAASTSYEANFKWLHIVSFRSYCCVLSSDHDVMLWCCDVFVILSSVVHRWGAITWSCAYPAGLILFVWHAIFLPLFALSFGTPSCLFRYQWQKNTSRCKNAYQYVTNQKVHDDGETRLLRQRNNSEWDYEYWNKRPNGAMEVISIEIIVSWLVTYDF